MNTDTDPTPAGSNVIVDGERLWDSLMQMAEIGATEKGGCCRLALTDLDKQSRDLFREWCEAAGCTIRIDKMGNIFARREGSEPDLPVVMVGSHLDTQPTGGRFDGVYGVLTGLEIIRSMNDLNVQTRHPIEVCVWTNEEGSRFAPAMVSSGVFGGIFDLEYGLSRADADGITMGEELQRIDYAGDEEVGGREVHVYFEAHIEQGPILEVENKTIGIVTDAQGQRWYEVTLTGVESHAGPTPMNRRKDALLGAAQVVQLVNQVGLDNAPLACATVGMLNVYPNSRNVIPGSVSFAIDFRHPDDDVLAGMDEQMRIGLEQITSRMGLGCELEQIFYYAPIAFDQSCVSAVRNAVKTHGYSSREIVSGAGHDACYLAGVAPTSMVFIPCVDGISHNEVEDAKPGWVTAGANVMLHAVLEKAEYA
ncbi:MAG: Zn-dependent hydrolase [Gammaproteobacteria bacterium]|nr:Zn-dependent hydrolase [Gammaproteobacteria bacterium]